MVRYVDNPRVRMALLLCALAAGTLTAQLIPTYEELAELRNRPATPSAASRANHHQVTKVTGIDVDRFPLELVDVVA